MALVPCIAISTGYILLVMFLCELARKTVAPLNDGLVKTALNEAIAAADLCGVCFELIIGVEIKWKKEFYNLHSISHSSC